MVGVTQVGWVREFVGVQEEERKTLGPLHEQEPPKHALDDGRSGDALDPRGPVIAQVIDRDGVRVGDRFGPPQVD